MAVRLEYNGKKYKNVIELTREIPLMTSVMVGWYDGAEVLVANAGALCYDTVQVAHDDETLIPNKIGQRISLHCRDSHHNTVIEHGSATFVKKVPIFVARQDLRARLASFDERSLRYCRAADGGLTYYVPNYLEMSYISRVMDKDPERAGFLLGMRQEWIDDHERAIYRYSKYTDEELNDFWDSLDLNPERIRETMRARLPVGINTVYMDTRNLWSWIHHAEKRLCLRAQDEIRRIRRQETHQLKKVFPTIFGDVNMPCYMASGCPEKKKCGLIELDESGKWALPFYKKSIST
ncbi:hypothetical protein BrL25_05165 [Brevibacillus laterosporus DSM 25]|uniref:FAD-dependent thymidylate synthase n=2 Tax=Brevibacillus laterosporus TaxID=1465 RepID=UPI0003641CD5|nr:FAD-dependent thymidylate synthase [Brevibacillus laterosporus]ATO48556.1 hypothetical protein BrL25_05165 [Brevibacillus laterosporus DSM 25]